MSNIRKGGGEKLIEVTQGLIDGAERSLSGRCMISDAVRAKYPHLQRIITDLQSIRVSDPKTNTRRVYWTSRTCQQALVDFDDGLPVEPFAFRLGPVIQEVPMQSGSGSRKAKAEKTGRGSGSSNFSNTSLPAKIGGRISPRPVALANQRRVHGVRSLRPKSEVLVPQSL